MVFFWACRWLPINSHKVLNGEGFEWRWWKMICQCWQSSLLAWFRDASPIQSWVTSSNSYSSSSALSSFFIRTKYQLIIRVQSQIHSSILCSLLCVLLIYVLNNNFLSHFIYNILTFVLSIIRSMTFYMEITQMGCISYQMIIFFNSLML